MQKTKTSHFIIQFSSTTTFAWYWFINKARKDNYKDFYATYDADKDFERMKVSHKNKWY